MDENTRELESRLAATWTSSRILSLTDNIFGFAMTLLVLNFFIPADLASENLKELFIDLWPQFLTYFMSFAVLGTFWVGQHNLLNLTKHVDRTSVWMHIVFASFIVLIPFTTGVLRAYYTETSAVMAYGVNVVICGLAAYWFWHHAIRARLLREDVTRTMVETMKFRIIIPVSGAVLVTLLGLFAPTVSFFLFAVLFILVTVPMNSDHIVHEVSRSFRGTKEK
jgi:uncharacterized membrane protein